ncbi:hypothetical protein HKX48_003050 [Thoreauomyces humboldtii]|nr:hypothetical protein HKX48_003050 [Thoreauomyces humboldtii]
MCFACKKCKKVFRKDMSNYEEEDEFCPNCDNHYVLVAKTPAMGLAIEGDDPRLEKDFRKKQIEKMTEQDFMADRMG